MSSGGNLCKAILKWAKTNDTFDTKFVDSVKKQFEVKGKISPKQKQALENIMKKFKIEELDSEDEEDESEDEDEDSDDSEETVKTPPRLVKWKNGEDLE